MPEFKVTIDDIYYGEKSIRLLISEFEILYNAISSIDCIDLKNANLLSSAVDDIKKYKEDIEKIYEKIHNLKTNLAESSEETSLLFSYLDGEFLNDEGFMDEEMIEDAIENLDSQTDTYGLLAMAASYNELYANSQFIYIWQSGIFLDENGNIDYDKLEAYRSENDKATNIDETIQMYLKYQSFNELLYSGKFVTEDGWDQTSFEKYVVDNQLDEVYANQLKDVYQQTYEANEAFLKAYENGEFLNPDNTWNQTKYNEYIANNSFVTCGESVRAYHEEKYPYLTPLEVASQTYVVTKASFGWGLLNIVEIVGDGLLWLFGAAAAGQANMNQASSWTLASPSYNYSDPLGTKALAAEAISYDWTEAGYDAKMEALNIREDIAYGMVHDVASAAGELTGSILLSFVPGGPVVQGCLGGLAAAGSATENALQSGATVDEAYFVGLGAASLGTVSAVGLDYVADAAKLSTSVDDIIKFTARGVGVTAIEPVGNSIIEFNTYGNEYYDTWWNYYVGSGALLNTGFAVTTGAFRTGISAVGGYFDNINKGKINTRMDASINGGFEGTSVESTSAWEEYFVSQYGTDAVERSASTGSIVDPEALAHNKHLDLEYEKYKDYYDLKYDVSKRSAAIDFEIEKATRRTNLTTVDRFIGQEFDRIELLRKQQADLSEYFIKTVGEKLGFSDTLIDRYIDVLDSDIRYSSQKIAARQGYLDTGVDWDSLSGIEQRDAIQAASSEQHYDLAKKRVLDNATETMFEYRRRIDSGNYFESGTTLEDVFDYKIKAKEMAAARYNGTITQEAYDNFLLSMKKDYSGIKYGEYLPTADKFISDDRVLEYVKLLCPDNPQIVSATNLEELALAIKDSGASVKTVTFQDANLGGNNIVHFKDFGYSTLQRGGPFVVPESSLIDYAKKYPKYCKWENGEFTILDYEKFGSEVLSGVPLSTHNGAYLVKTTVPINGENISIPSVLNGSSYSDFFVSGGELLSGQIEATIRPIKGIIPDGNWHMDSVSGILYEVLKLGGK